MGGVARQATQNARLGVERRTVDRRMERGPPQVFVKQSTTEGDDKCAVSTKAPSEDRMTVEVRESARFRKPQGRRFEKWSTPSPRLNNATLADTPRTARTGHHRGRPALPKRRRQGARSAGGGGVVAGQSVLFIIRSLRESWLNCCCVSLGVTIRSRKKHLRRDDATAPQDRRRRAAAADRNRQSLKGSSPYTLIAFPLAVEEEFQKNEPT